VVDSRAEAIDHARREAHPLPTSKAVCRTRRQAFGRSPRPRSKTSNATTQLSTVVIDAVPVEKAGVASGIHNTFRETGGALGIAVIGAVFASGQTHALTGGATRAHAFVSGYSSGLTLGGLLAIAAAGIATFALRPRRARVPELAAPVAA
jgi:hypothetical protein